MTIVTGAGMIIIIDQEETTVVVKAATVGTERVQTKRGRQEAKGQETEKAQVEALPRRKEQQESQEERQ